MQNIELADSGFVIYHETFLPPDLADRYFTELRDTAPWEQRPGVFGHMQPRLTASYGDSGVTYRYSGTLNVALPWTPTLLEIKEKIEAVQGKYIYCLLNRYRPGADSVGMHADDEPGEGNVIGSLSLGATRTFRIKHNKTKETRMFQVGNGTLIVMAGTMQQFWKHEVPKTIENVGERINLRRGATMTNPLTFGLLILAVAVTTAAADDTPPYKITTKRDNDKVDVKTEKDKVTFSVHSPFGISHAAIERAGEKWPDAVVLKLHLKGLENFKVKSGEVKLEGSASLQDGKPLVRLWKDGKEDTPLDAQSPYWMEVRILGGDGKQATELPLKDGCFETPLPKALFEGNPKTITVNWIDFYRN